MDTLNWQGYEWLKQERWGQMHPNNTSQWNDPEAIELRDGCLVLKTHYNPKVFNILKDDKPLESVMSPIGMGLISCTEKFGYGRFESEIKLPKGPNLWPAFWVWSFESWPPEIDMFEAYPNKRESYFNWDIRALIGQFWKVETNIHLGVSPDNYALGAKKHFFSFRNPSKRFINYALEWRPDSIKIFYGKRCVREITDDKVLSQFRGKTMNVIINNGIHADYLKLDEKYMYQTEMYVKNFKYTSYE